MEEEKQIEDESKGNRVATGKKRNKRRNN